MHWTCWNGNVILMNFSSLAAPEVVKMTTSNTPSDENLIKMMTSISVWVAMFLWPCMCSSPCFNSLAPGRPRCHFKTAIFNDVLLIGIFTSSKDNALRWMPRDLTDNKSTLVQVMAWCRQATSHYLSQCWPSSMSPYGVTRPQWVNLPDSKDPWINVD